jgi:hypothetical protein
VVAYNAPGFAICDTLAAPSDKICAECGSSFGVPAPVVAPYALAAYSAKNQERFLA